MHTPREKVTKAPRISVRVPLHDHEWLRLHEMSEETGLSIGRILSNAFRDQIERTTTIPKPITIQQDCPAPDCTMVTYTIIETGSAVPEPRLCVNCADAVRAVHLEKTDLGDARGVRAQVTQPRKANRDVT